MDYTSSKHNLNSIIFVSSSPKAFAEMRNQKAFLFICVISTLNLIQSKFSEVQEKKVKDKDLSKVAKK